MNKLIFVCVLSALSETAKGTQTGSHILHSSACYKANNPKSLWLATANIYFPLTCLCLWINGTAAALLTSALHVLSFNGLR